MELSLCTKRCQFNWCNLISFVFYIHIFFSFKIWLLSFYRFSYSAAFWWKINSIIRVALPSIEQRFFVVFFLITEHNQKYMTMFFWWFWLAQFVSQWEYIIREFSMEANVMNCVLGHTICIFATYIIVYFTNNLNE